MRRFFPCWKAVSYTHLDVYKRQDMIRALLQEYSTPGEYKNQTRRTCGLNQFNDLPEALKERGWELQEFIEESGSWLAVSEEGLSLIHISGKKGMLLALKIAGGMFAGAVVVCVAAEWYIYSCLLYTARCV